MTHRKPKQILGLSKEVGLSLLESITTLACFCATLSRRATHKLTHGTCKLSKRKRVLKINKKRRGGDENQYEFDEEGFGEGGLWRKSILLGDKCDPLNFSGVIYYDCNGNILSEVPIRSPRATPLFMAHGY